MFLLCSSNRALFSALLTEAEVISPYMLWACCWCYICSCFHYNNRSRAIWVISPKLLSCFLSLLALLYKYIHQSMSSPEWRQTSGGVFLPATRARGQCWGSGRGVLRPQLLASSDPNTEQQPNKPPFTACNISLCWDLYFGHVFFTTSSWSSASLML